MSRPTKPLLGSVLLLCAPLAVAQSNLGELLDAGGAQKLTVDEFKTELVQRPIVGQTPTGSRLQIVYGKTGVIAGEASVPNAGTMTLTGEWTIDDSGRICTSLTFTRANNELLRRCEFWFKYKQEYFLSVSDSDRQAKLLRRAIKQ